MRKRAYNPNQRYQTIEGACKTTGLSMYYLRKGCKDGSIPHIRSGRVYYVDVYALTMRGRSDLDPIVQSEV